MKRPLCPKCHDVLSEVRLAGVTFDKCASCHGLWFDSSELSALLTDAYAEEPGTDRPTNNDASSQGTGRCPRCEIPLTEVSSISVPGTAMDICAQCDGIWLDLGEFTRIKHKEPQGAAHCDVAYGTRGERAAATEEFLDNAHFSLFENEETARQDSLRSLVLRPRNMNRFAETPKKTIPSDAYEWEGKVRIVVCGFSQQSVVSIDEIVAAIEILPDRHLVNVDFVSYDPKRSIQQGISRYTLWLYNRYYPVDFAARAQYFGGGDIAIYGFRSKAEFHTNLYHEIGHHVFDRILSPGGQSKWIERIYPNSQKVSSYARTSPIEGFAETYTHYVLHRERLRKGFPAKFRFMFRDVFRGFEPDVLRLGLPC